VGLIGESVCGGVGNVITGAIQHESFDHVGEDFVIGAAGGFTNHFAKAGGLLKTLEYGHPGRLGQLIQEDIAEEVIDQGIEDAFHDWLRCGFR
jgi:hypothetical protein